MGTITFPQANDIKKVIKILNADESQVKDKELMMKKLDITYRQILYYYSACQYLEILTSDYSFTEEAKNIKLEGISNRKKWLVKKILSKPVFSHVFNFYLANNKLMSKDEIICILLSEESVQSVNVAERRTGTVVSWMRWIIEELGL
jgi:hypothetical protein